MAKIERGDVWLVDLGMAAKVRPALVISQSPDETDRALITIVPHTTNLRGSVWEIRTTARFLKPGAFNLQNILSIPESKLIRKLGMATNDEMELVEAGLRQWLGL